MNTPAPDLDSKTLEPTALSPQTLAPQTLAPVHRRRHWTLILLSAMAATLGGFAGAFVVQHGPVYLSINVVEPAVASLEAEPAAEEPVAVPEHSDIPEEARPFLQGEGGVLLVHSERGSYAILSDVVIKSWMSGKAKHYGDEDDMFFMSERKVDVGSLPDGLAGWPGKELALYGQKGFVCKATVGDPVYLQQVAGYERPSDFAQEQDYIEGVLAAPLQLSGRDCKQSSWGRVADLPAPDIARIESAKGTFKREVIKRFRKDAEYQKLQREFRKAGHTGQWVSFDGMEMEMQLVESAGQRLVYVSASVGGCGDFEGSMARVYELNDAGELSELPIFPGSALYGLDAAADMDGDGDLELIVHEDGYDKSLMRQGELGIKVETTNKVAIFYCRC